MVIINNENKSLEAVIALDGAELLSVRRESYEYMWQAHKKYWSRTAPVLFPIVGRLQDDQYTINQEVYKMTQHGFARDMRFTIKNQTETSVSLELVANDESKVKYPYDFSLVINYSFKNDELTVEYIVTNTDKQEINYSIGAHPGFNLTPGNEYTFAVNAVEKRYTLDGAFIGEIVDCDVKEYSIEPEQFKNDAVILETTNDEKVVTIFENGNEYIKMNYNDFKLLGVWSPYNEELPFVCLEPWNGVADFAQKASTELKDKDFINHLAIGASDKQEYTITFY